MIHILKYLNHISRNMEATEKKNSAEAIKRKSAISDLSPFTKCCVTEHPSNGKRAADVMAFRKKMCSPGPFLPHDISLVKYLIQ